MARRSNLPRSLPPLVGRAEAITAAGAAVRASRLVTLTGPGGVGKTRLALAVAAELAEDFPDGVWLVELAAVADGDAVADAIATALGVTPHGDDRIIDTVAEAVTGRRLLLVVDNCEHVLAAAARAIGEILAGSDIPRVLATSRELLLAPGEAVVPVTPLSVETGVTSAAVTLFVQRAGAARAEYAIHDEQSAAAVIEICEALDGLPLGIELAAARMAAMSATEVRDRLTDRMRLLTGPESGPDRQSTLRHVVAWSYDLLDEDERNVLRTAAVFSGGFVLESLCSVAGEDDDIEMLRHLDSARPQVAGRGPPRHGADPLQPLRHDSGVRRGAAVRSRPARGHPRPARGVLRPRGGPSLGPVERPRVARSRRLGPGGAGQPALGVPLERGPRRRRGGHRCGRARGVDGLLGGAVRDRGLGRSAARGRRARGRPPPAEAVRRRGLRLLRRTGCGRGRERAPCDRAGGPAGLRVLRAGLCVVHRGAG